MRWWLFSGIASGAGKCWMALVVVPVRPPQDAIEDIVPPVEMARPGHGKLYAAAVLLIVLAAIAIWVYRRLREARVAAPPPPENSYESALAGLERIASETYEACAFHTACATVLRSYVEARFGVEAKNATTPELMARLASAPQRKELAALLARCDEVKFAGRRPSREEGQTLEMACREWIQATRLEMGGSTGSMLFQEAAHGD